MNTHDLFLKLLEATGCEVSCFVTPTKDGPVCRVGCWHVLPTKESLGKGFTVFGSTVDEALQTALDKLEPTRAAQKTHDAAMAAMIAAMRAAQPPAGTVPTDDPGPGTGPLEGV